MKKRHSPEQIVAKLRRADVELGKGLRVPEVCKRFEISEQTYYRWRGPHPVPGPGQVQPDKGLRLSPNLYQA